MIRPAARAIGALTAVIALPVACGDGTSGWVLTRDHSSPPLALGASSGTSAGNGGRSTDGGAAGAPQAGSGTGGESGAAGAVTAGAGGAAVVGPRDPDDFAEVCTPTVTVDNRTATGNGQLFTDSLPEPEAFMVTAARRACALLYLLPSEVPVTTELTVLIEDFDGAGELLFSGSSTIVRLSSSHMRNVADGGGDVAAEIAGISQFLIGLDYGFDNEDPGATSWLHSGLGDWVRFRTGYTQLDQRTPGGTWTDGFKTTAFFVEWLEQNHEDAAYRLNQSLNPGDGIAWTEEVFVELTGSDLPTLWSEYQASLQ